MDNDTNVSEVRSTGSEPGTVRTLTKIVPLEWPAERLQWLWRQVMSQDYSFDDLMEKAGASAFLNQIFDTNSEWYEIGDDGIAVVSGIMPLCNAVVHFATWGDINPRELFVLQNQLFSDLFENLKLNRLSAYIPSFNKQAIRMATVAGFRYEGELRKIYLKHGVYHNLRIFGLLKEEFNRRGVKH